MALIARFIWFLVDCKDKIIFFNQKFATAKINSRETLKYDQFTKINTHQKFFNSRKLIPAKYNFFWLAKINTRKISSPKVVILLKIAKMWR